MKTTAEIPGPLPAAAKKVVAREKTTIRSLIEEGLRLALARRREGAHARHLVSNEEPARLAHVTRYLVRPPVATDRDHALPDAAVSPGPDRLGGPAPDVS